MGHRHALIVIHRQLAFARRNGEGQTSGRVDLAKDDTCQCLTARLTGIIGAKQGIGIGLGPVHVERPALNINHDERFTRCLECFEQLLLTAEQAEGGAVETFAAVHVAHRLVVGLSCSCFLIISLKITCARPADGHDDGIRLAGGRNRLGYIIVGRVANGATFGINHVIVANQLPDALQQGGHFAVGLRCRIVAQHIIYVVGVGTYHGHFHVTA